MWPATKRCFCVWANHTDICWPLCSFMHKYVIVVEHSLIRKHSIFIYQMPLYILFFLLPMFSKHLLIIQDITPTLWSPLKKINGLVPDLLHSLNFYLIALILPLSRYLFTSVFPPVNSEPLKDRETVCFLLSSSFLSHNCLWGLLWKCACLNTCGEKAKST